MMAAHSAAGDRRPILFCLAPAGQTASRFYHRWTSWVGDVIDVVALDVPGRGEQSQAQRAITLADLVHELARTASSQIGGGRTWAVFGHSFGALMAYELARALQSLDGVQPPIAAVLSGRGAPGEVQRRSLHQMDDDTLFAEVMAWGGVPEIFTRPALRPLLLRGLREDLALAAAHVHQANPPLHCPMNILLGDADPLVDQHGASQWSKVTTHRTEVYTFAGGHGYLGDGRVVAPVVRAQLGSRSTRNRAPLAVFG